MDKYSFTLHELGPEERDIQIRKKRGWLNLPALDSYETEEE